MLPKSRQEVQGLRGSVVSGRRARPRVRDMLAPVSLGRLGERPFQAPVGSILRILGFRKNWLCRKRWKKGRLARLKQGRRQVGERFAWAGRRRPWGDGERGGRGERESGVATSREVAFYPEAVCQVAKEP